MEKRELDSVARSPGDGFSFEGFYARQYASTLRVVYALCGSWEVAEEICQDAFLRALQRWSEVSGMDRPDAWLRRVACNLATSWLRRLSAETRARARLAGRRSEPSGWLLAEDTERFWAVVRSLPRRQAQVVTLHYAEDRSVGDIAVILGVAEGTVKAHLFAARRRLEVQLVGDDVEGSR